MQLTKLITSLNDCHEITYRDFSKLTHLLKQRCLLLVPPTSIDNNQITVLLLEPLNSLLSNLDWVCLCVAEEKKMKRLYYQFSPQIFVIGHLQVKWHRSKLNWKQVTYLLLSRKIEFNRRFTTHFVQITGNTFVEKDCLEHKLPAIERNFSFRRILFELIERTRSKRISANQGWLPSLLLIMICIFRASCGLSRTWRTRLIEWVLISKPKKRQQLHVLSNLIINAK